MAGNRDFGRRFFAQADANGVTDAVSQQCTDADSTLDASVFALSDEAVAAKIDAWKAGLGKKIEKANEDLKEVKYTYKCN